MSSVISSSKCDICIHVCILVYTSWNVYLRRIATSWLWLCSFTRQLVRLDKDIKSELVNGDTARLEISAVGPLHTGLYTCTAYNELGQDSTSALLTISGKVLHVLVCVRRELLTIAKFRAQVHRRPSRQPLRTDRKKPYSVRRH